MHKLFSVLKLLTGLLGLLYLSGCASTVIQAYQGKPLPLSDVGVVTCASAIQVVSVDGNKDYHLYSGGGLYYRDCVITLKPGKHVINYQYYFSSNIMSIYSPIRSANIDIEPGQIYRIKYKLHTGGWKTWIEKLQGAELAKERKDIPLRIKNQTGVQAKETNDNLSRDKAEVKKLSSAKSAKLGSKSSKKTSNSAATKASTQSGHILTGSQIKKIFTPGLKLLANPPHDPEYMVTVGDYGFVTRYCEACNLSNADGEIKIKYVAGQVCLGWFKATYPTSGCFTVEAVDHNVVWLHLVGGDKVAKYRLAH